MVVDVVGGERGERRGEKRIQRWAWRRRRVQESARSWWWYERKRWDERRKVIIEPHRHQGQRQSYEMVL